MWILLIMILVGPGGSTALERFANEEDCWIEQKRIARAMADAYPDDASFVILCEYRARKI